MLIWKELWGSHIARWHVTIIYCACTVDFFIFFILSANSHGVMGRMLELHMDQGRVHLWTSYQCVRGPSLHWLLLKGNSVVYWRGIGTSPASHTPFCFCPAWVLNQKPYNFCPLHSTCNKFRIRITDNQVCLTTVLQSSYCIDCFLCLHHKICKMMLPFHYELQVCLGVLDLVVGLYIQHISSVFSVDLQDNVATLQVCVICLAAPNDLFNIKMSSSYVQLISGSKCLINSICLASISSSITVKWPICQVMIWMSALPNLIFLRW